ncbi:alkaline phosphatase [Catenovulum agarivorans]|uniref:alkaline phosphatase n=1 Tax=Catenovulum agarivorans TaxID=1172192 RepID=UPI0002DC7EFB|nr:alkaline phosphatase [Catenovulum agarivorans]
MRFIHYTLLFVLIGLFSLALLKTDTQTSPKNIILVIGDGMGDNYLSAYRYWRAKSPDNVSPTIFDQLLVGKSMSYPDDDTFVTDSAAGATAYAAAQKTYNGAISVNHNGDKLTTLMELAKQHNKTTAIVATSEVVHATPATFFAHQGHRKEYPQIADQIVDNQINNKPIIDLILGGGISYLVREDRNLLNELKTFGYAIHTDWANLNQITSLPAIGVFADKGLAYEINSKQQRLEQMTQVALQQLTTDANSKKNGFFIMIEASQIDWCGHANDIACAMHEMDDLANTLSLLKQFVDDHPNTLMVVTADHETGGLSIGAEGQYNWLPDVIAGVNNSLDSIGDTLAQTNDENLYATWLTLTSIELEQPQILALNAAKNSGKNALIAFSRKQINNKSLTGWTSGGHTAADVPVLAYGAQSQLFYGFHDNIQIGQKLFELIQHTD